MSNAVSDPPAFPNPLRTARISSLVKESATLHTQNDRDSYLREKDEELTHSLKDKHLIYLDVCHWINLRHVWLQSPKSLPIYEKIAKRLNFLAQRDVVICPFSYPIFEELMKQTDPLSRAATAHLIEAFSRGICIRPFRDAFLQQWRNYSAHQSSRDASLSLTKIGFLVPESVFKSVLYTPTIDHVWDNICLDLQWNLTLDDFQRLTVLGHTEQADKPSYLNKWHDLPARQRSQPCSFLDLVKECRLDIIRDCVGIFGDSEDLITTELVKEPQIYGHVPCCEVAAGMCAAQVFQGGKVRANDVYDFMHASAGIPCCEAYFCDRPMEYLLTRKPLELHSHFEAKISSSPEQLLNHLNNVS